MVRRQLSILKLHGSAYGLRLGERLKYPLEADDRSNTLDYIPPDALILVMGFNGSERRIMQMLNAMTKKQNQGLGSNKSRLIWIQGPGAPGPLYKELAHVQSCEVKHIDTFLIELYFYITSNSYQSSSKPYSTISGKPLSTELIITLPKTSEQKQLHRRPVQLCLANSDENGRSSDWASLDAIAFINSLDNGYTVIWIDLVNHHTVEGIVADFFNQVHKVDSQAPSCLITSIDHNSKEEICQAIYKKTIERICDVFKRGRYILVLDSVESFGRPQMVHHGETSYNEKSNLHYKQIDNLKIFFSELLNMEKKSSSLKSYWDSYVVVTVNKPSYRHHKSHNDKNGLIKLFEELRDNYGKYDHKHIYIRFQGQKKGYGELIIGLTRPSPDPSKRLTKHWNNTLNETVEKYSLERVKNVLNLLQILRSNKEKKTIDDKNSVEAFICLLSVFRRPRSFPLLRSIMERWALRKIGEDLLDDNVSITAHIAINDLLKTLSEKNNLVGVVLQIHEGGIIWLFREVYEATYDALTENIHIQEWLKKWEENQNPVQNESSLVAIMDGVLNISWHLFAARAYYVDVFLPTHDINAFYEYIYHRVSATRIITLLITIIEKNDESLVEKLDEHCNDIFLLYKDDFDASTNKPFNWYAEVIGVFDPIFQDQIEIDSKDNLLINFKLLRKHALETLLMALTKNSLLFRSVAIPDTVLAWSNQFLEIELDNMHKIEINGGDKKEPDFDIKETIEKLEKKFNILKYQAQMSKMGFKNILGDFNYVNKEEEIVSVIKKIVSPDSNKNIVTKAKGEVNTFLKNTECLVHTCDSLAFFHADLIYKALLIRGDSSVQNWLKTKQRDALELRARSRFKNWSFWQPLLDRVNSQLRIELSELKHAEKDSILYEDLLRGTTKTNDEDAKHRSTALTIRARSLYLRGHFPQAHHFLDLASTGLHSERLEHRLLISVVHIVRTELLTISAHEHYFSGSKHDQIPVVFKHKLGKSSEQINFNTNEDAEKLIAIAKSSLKKIERGEQELLLAEKLLRTLTHQNNWLIHMEFGWIHIRIERMLYEVESMFFSWESLSVTQYLQKSGDLEQKILDCMQRLRAILDVIPYQFCSWEDINKDSTEVKAGRSMFQIECSVYKLWRQLFVVGAFYSNLLYELYCKNIMNRKEEDGSMFVSKIARIAHTTSDSRVYLKQWERWCISMRFVNFGKNVKPCNITVSHSSNTYNHISLRATIIENMLKQSKSELIEEMWKIRREVK